MWAGLCTDGTVMPYICVCVFVHTAAGVSSSTIKGLSGAGNDMSKTEFLDYHKCSTVCLHPEGERSSASSVTSSYMNLSCSPRCQKRRDFTSETSTAVSLNVVSSTSSFLPKPGDPGAPPLPDDVTPEEQNRDSVVCESTGSGGDANFLPLRSRSLFPIVGEVL